MGDSGNQIVTEIKLELDKFRADLKQAEKDGAESGKKGGEGLGKGFEDSLSSTALSVKAAFVAAAGAIASAFTLKEAIHAASEQESAIRSLNVAMQLSGTYSDEASKHIQDLASSLQKTTTVADETTVKGAALLVTMGKLKGEGLDRATKAALDLSAAMGIDVDSAFNLVAKASTGHIAAFTRYGLKMKETGNASEDFGNALKVLEQRFGGVAAALASGTFDGAMAKAKNQFGEVLESIGNMIIKSPTVISAINILAKSFESAAESLAKWSKNRDVINEFAVQLVEIGKAVDLYVVAPLELAFNIANYGVKFIAQAFGGLTVILVEIGKGINDYLISPLLNLLQNVLGPVIGMFDADLAASINNFLATANQTLTQGLNDTAQVQAAVLQQMSANTEEASNNLFDFNVSTAADAFLTKTDQFLAQVKPVITQKLTAAVVVPPTMFEQFVKGFTSVIDVSKDMGKAMEALGKQVFNTMAVGVTNSFAAMGAAAVKGQNALGALGNAFLGVLGDMAIQAGAAFMAQGLAMTFALMPNGPPLIVAGAALATIGGALKAQAGAGGGGSVATAPAAPSPGGGGLAASADMTGGQNQNQVAQNSLERSQVGTSVAVNIQGNVLDRKETGMMIADTINDQFGSNGVTFATGTA